MYDGMMQLYLQLRLGALSGDSALNETVRIRLRSKDGSVLACVLDTLVP
jgi:hypothetical protein